MKRLQSAREAINQAVRAERQGGFFVGKRPPKIPDSAYRDLMKLERELGLYLPKGSKLTPSRKRAIIRHYEELDNFAKTATFTQYPKGSRQKTRREIARQARAKGHTVTKRGIFVKRDSGQIAKLWDGRIEKDRATDSWIFKVTTTTKKKRRVTEKRFISADNALNLYLDQLRHLFVQEKTKLTKRQRLRFLIGQSGNASRRVFQNMDQLINYAMHYRDTAEGQASFIDELTIVVVEPRKPRAKQYRIVRTL